MYTQEQGLWVAQGSAGPLSIIGKMANRHGLIAGATGTGKTVTLQVMAETFSQAGVPCFMADMKGDLSGISQTGHTSSFIEKRQVEFGIDSPTFQGCPVRFFDVFGEQGHPMRTTISDMGPDLLARLLDLNDTQAGVLNIAFKVADDNDLIITDLKDIRAVLDFVSKSAKEVSSTYGNVTAASIGAIQRQLLALQTAGGDKFFGEPAFDYNDLFKTVDGKGMLSVLAADKLMLQPKLYSTFLLWLMSTIYANLPEVGDQPLPKLIFFFDEAHTLFDGTSRTLVQKIEQVIRLIRSKGVGIYFITQNPTDIPDTILGQLGNRVQHALRAFTPKDQKAVRAAADTFRANPAFDTKEAISTLETGEALVSFLDAKGSPSIVEKARILFPLSQIGAVTDQQRLQIIRGSDLAGKYDEAVDNVSAYEQIMAAQQAEQEAAQQAAADKKAAKEAAKPGMMSKILKSISTAVLGVFATAAGSMVADAISGKESKTSAKDLATRAAKNATSAVTRQIGRSITGTLTRK